MAINFLNELLEEATVTFGNMEEGICADLEIPKDLIRLEIDSDVLGLRKISFVSSEGKNADIG